MAWLKSIAFLLLVPGTVMVFLPWLLFDLSLEGIARGTPMTRLAAIVLSVGGVALLLRAMWGFVVEGKGTPSPAAPPSQLVVKGPYRFTRNPMYVGVLLVLAAESLLFSIPALFLYAVLVAVGFHCFIVLYEEPALRRTFGAAYLAYCEAVPRWLPAARPASRGADQRQQEELPELPGQDHTGTERKE